MVGLWSLNYDPFCLGVYEATNMEKQREDCRLFILFLFEDWYLTLAWKD